MWAQVVVGFVVSWVFGESSKISRVWTVFLLPRYASQPRSDDSQPLVINLERVTIIIIIILSVERVGSKISRVWNIFCTTAFHI